MGRPLGTIIEVMPDSKEMEVNGFVITANGEHTPEKGTVLSVGDEVEGVNKGDRILFKKGAYSKVTIEGREVLLLERKSVYYVL